MTGVLAAPTHLIQVVRARYGLGLAPLAALLGVSVSLLGLAATNRRELPTAALLRLLPLGQALPPPWSQGAPDPDPAPEFDPDVDPTPVLAPLLPHPPDSAALLARRADGQHPAPAPRPRAGRPTEPPTR